MRQEPWFNSISEVSSEHIHEVSYNRVKSFHMISLAIALFIGNSIKIAHTMHTSPIHIPIQHPQRCDGEHRIDVCKKFKKDKERYNLSRATITNKYCKLILKRHKEEQHGNQ